MDHGSYLDPGSIKAQCEGSIRVLQNDNDALQTAESSLDAFINDSEIKSSAFDTLKQQLSDYKTIIQAMKTANHSDMEDYQILKNGVGDEILNGSTILTQKENAEALRRENKAKVLFYRSAAALTVPSSAVLMEYNRKMVDYYEHLAEIYQSLYEKWEEKEKKYDEIESATSGLFENSGSLRTAIKAGISDIAGSFQGGAYVPNMDAVWRDKIREECIILRVKYSGTTESQFKENMKKQFGFDDETTQIMWNVYENLRIKYKDASQQEFRQNILKMMKN